MMSTGAWIFLGLIVLVVVIVRSSRAGRAASPAEPDLNTRFKNADAMKPELVKEGVRMAYALPIVDEGSSWLLHQPIYDARTDMFDPPCKESGFGYSSGNCWVSPESLPDEFQIWADQTASFRAGIGRPLVNVIVPAPEHLDIIACLNSVNEPGLRVIRLCRVAEDRWHSNVWSCALAPGANSIVMSTGRMHIELGADSSLIDPPLRAQDVAADPSLWTQRNARVRERWPKDGNWRDAASLCTHK